MVNINLLTWHNERILNMVVLGIDPGLANTGYSILKYDYMNENIQVLKYGLISTSIKDGDTWMRLLSLYRQLEKIYMENGIDYTVFEESYSMGAAGKGTSLIKYVIGVLFSLSVLHNTGICSINPSTIKKNMLKSHNVSSKRWSLNLVKVLYPYTDIEIDHISDSVLLATYFIKNNQFIVGR